VSLAIVKTGTTAYTLSDKARNAMRITHV
jgi:hypothetical protein